ncbi:guanine nucleotide-binding protein subunit beta-like protein 1 [Lampris incognitus]|uniref:guanine nucleotide-binding protein subunit beta-like protein 1 n=1 Tax=Lampris incognitus TaxID=2546036 RepID=UPI0024B4EB67|nr:guanine nucleotide-binding protein subunit beta-like protein 1 [Lampris incognitus]
MSRPAPSPIYTLRGAGAPLNALHFCCSEGDHPLLFSGSAKGTIHVWNLNTRRAEKILEGHSGNSVIWMNTLQSTDALISQGRDMRVCLWDLCEGRSEVSDSVWTGSVGFCHCSLLEMGPATSLLAYPGREPEEINIIELPSKAAVCTLTPEAKRGMVMCIKLWQPDTGCGPLLLAGYEDGSLLLWDVSQRAMLSSAAVHPEPVMCLTFDPKRLKGISGSSEKNLLPWVLDRQNKLQLQDPVALVNPGVSQLCIRGDSKILASAGWDHRVRIFGWKKLQPLAVLQHHTDIILSVAFSNHQDPRHQLLAAGSKDQRISLWSIYNKGSGTG